MTPPGRQRNARRLVRSASRINLCVANAAYLELYCQFETGSLRQL